MRCTEMQNAKCKMQNWNLAVRISLSPCRGDPAWSPVTSPILRWLGYTTNSPINQHIQGFVHPLTIVQISSVAIPATGDHTFSHCENCRPYKGVWCITTNKAKNSNLKSNEDSEGIILNSEFRIPNSEFQNPSSLPSSINNQNPQPI